MRVQAITALLIACTLLLLNSTARAEDIYRWVDEAGTVHFGSLPPDGVDAKLVRTVAAPAPEAATQPQTPDAAQSVPKQKSPAEVAREEREQRRAEQRREQATLDAQCAAMRQQQAQLEPSPRVIVRDENGEVRRLDDDERLKLVEEAKTFIAENCE